MESQIPSWADDFLFWTVIIVAFLSAVDWLLGPKNRAEIRERVGIFWLHLGEITYRELAFEDAGEIKRWLEKWFGDRAISSHRMISVLIFSFTVTIVFFFIVRGFMVSNNIIHEAHVGYTVFMITFPNWLSDMISLSITLMLLERMVRYGSVTLLIGFLILDILVATALVILGTVFSLSIGMVVLDLGFGIEVISNNSRLEHVVDGPGKDHGRILLLLFFPAVIFFTAAFPTIVHVLYTILMILLKFARGVVRPVVMLILYRFHESKKGVLTNIAVVVGALAKIVQESLKYIG